MPSFRILFPICLLGFFSFAFHSTDSTLPKDVERKLRRDAARLALRLHIGILQAKDAPIEISPSAIESLFDALALVYTETEQGESLYRCNVHTYPSPSIDHLALIYERDVDWAKPLREGLTQTDNTTFNRLLEQYDLFIERHVQWTDTQDALTIRSHRPLNMAAIAPKFMAIKGIQEMDLGTPSILGSDIEARQQGKDYQLDYILRFGGWATGKGKTHTWKFKVANGTKVSFLSDSGDEVPKWMRCRNNTDKWTNL